MCKATETTKYTDDVQLNVLCASLNS